METSLKAHAAQVINKSDSVKRVTLILLRVIGAVGGGYAFSAATVAFGATLDEPQLARVGQGVGTLFLTPDIGETLRVNGRVLAVSDGAIEIAVEECYLHCAKALIRSGFWNVAPRSDVPDEAQDFLAVSQFMALATINARGQADITNDVDFPGENEPIPFTAGWSSLLYFAMMGTRTHPTPVIRKWLETAGFRDIRKTNVRSTAQLIGRKP